MINKAKAETFAEEWIDAWNDRDLERVLSHYADNVEFSSPFVTAIAGEPSGVLSGKDHLSNYWEKALSLVPDLRFELESVRWGVTGLVINYGRQDGSTASEWFEFGKDGLVVRSFAQYDRDFTKFKPTSS